MYNGRMATLRNRITTQKAMTKEQLAEARKNESDLRSKAGRKTTKGTWATNVQSDDLDATNGNETKGQ